MYRIVMVYQNGTPLKLVNHMPSTSQFPWKRNLIVCLLGSFTTVTAMTLMLPFLPVYVEQLGVSGHKAIMQWSGIAYSATFISAGLVAPLWGYLGDRFGRKSMLVRASLGMAICMVLMGLVSDIWQLAGLRLIVGLAGGYSSGATILVAIQTPKKSAGQALGLLSSGVMAGNLIGPLVGGMLPPLIGIRPIFWGASALIFLAFLATALLVREAPQMKKESPKSVSQWSQIRNKNMLIAMLVSGLVLMVANMSIEPIITVYVSGLIQNPVHATTIAGFVMSAAALGSILSSFALGRLADRVGYLRIIILALFTAAILLVPQAFVTASWQLIGLRFLMGLALGGLLPCIAAVIRHNVPETFVGTVLGYSLSAQFAGQFVGPILGGFVGGHLGISAVFMSTSLLLFICALYVFRINKSVTS